MDLSGFLSSTIIVSSITIVGPGWGASCRRTALLIPTLRLVDNGFKKLLASYRVLVGIWAPVAAAELLSLRVPLALNSSRSASPVPSVPVENEIRRVLRLRIEATSALAQFMEEDTQNDGMGEREAVAKLVGWGAKVQRSKSKSKSTKVNKGGEDEKRPIPRRMISDGASIYGQGGTSSEMSS